MYLFILLESKSVTPEEFSLQETSSAPCFNERHQCLMNSPLWQEFRVPVFKNGTC